jgi:hypothetical protein
LEETSEPDSAGGVTTEWNPAALRIALAQSLASEGGSGLVTIEEGSAERFATSGTRSEGSLASEESAGRSTTRGRQKERSGMLLRQRRGGEEERNNNVDRSGHHGESPTEIRMRKELRKCLSQEDDRVEESGHQEGIICGHCRHQGVQFDTGGPQEEPG